MAFYSHPRRPVDPIQYQDSRVQQERCLAKPRLYAPRRISSDLTPGPSIQSYASRRTDVHLHTGY